MSKKPKPKFWNVEYRHPTDDDRDWGGYVFQDLYEDLSIVIEWAEMPLPAYSKLDPDLMRLDISSDVRRKDFERIPDKDFQEVLNNILTVKYVDLPPEIRAKLETYKK